MDSRKIVFKETAIVAAGEAVCCAIMVGVLAAFNHFQLAVLFSAIAGFVLAVANYFLMAMVVSLATDKAQQGQVQQAKKMVQISSVVRLFLMALFIIAGYFLKANLLALALPLLFQRPILLVAEFLRKKGD